MAFTPDIEPVFWQFGARVALCVSRHSQSGIAALLIESYTRHFTLTQILNTVSVHRESESPKELDRVIQDR
jgi:hypothetical protein